MSWRPKHEPNHLKIWWFALWGTCALSPKGRRRPHNVSNTSPHTHTQTRPLTLPSVVVLQLTSLSAKNVLIRTFVVQTDLLIKKRKRLNGSTNVYRMYLSHRELMTRPVWFWQKRNKSKYRYKSHLIWLFNGAFLLFFLFSISRLLWLTYRKLQQDLKQKMSREIFNWAETIE